MNLKKWIYPVFAIVPNILIIQFLKQDVGVVPLPREPQIILAMTGILPIFGLTSTIFDRKKLNIINIVFLITANIILFLSSVLWIGLIIVDLDSSELLASFDKFCAVILQALTGYVFYIVARIIQNKNEQPNQTFDETRLSNSLRSQKSTKKSKLILLSLIPLLTIFALYGLNRLSVYMAKNNIDIGVRQYDINQPLIAYQTQKQRHKIWIKANSFTDSEETVKGNPMFKIKVTGARELSEKQKERYGFPTDKRIAAIDFDLTILDKAHLWGVDSHRIRDSNGNWLESKKISTNFMDMLSLKETTYTLAFEVDSQETEVTLFIYSKDWRSSDDEAVKFVLNIEE